MSVLALDTAGPNPSVVLLVGDRLVEESLPPDGRASEDLLPAVAWLFESSGQAITKCRRIAVCAGPGSFTGVRVGLATAWGIGRALGIPVEPVSTLEALAEAARSLSARRVAAFLDAGRGEVVGARFDLSPSRARELAPPERLAAAEAARFAGDAAMAALPADLVEPAAPKLPSSLAAALARAVARSPRETSPALTAIYARPSAAEEKQDKQDKHGAS